MDSSRYLNGVICTFAGLIWAGLARQFVPETILGAAIMLVPGGVLVVVGAYLTGMARIDHINNQRK